MFGKLPMILYNGASRNRVSTVFSLVEYLAVVL